jgi:ketosteroid isomerase-like protein
LSGRAPTVPLAVPCFGIRYYLSVKEKIVIKRIVLVVSFTLVVSTAAFSQNSNSSLTTVRPRPTNSNQSAQQIEKATPKPGTTSAAHRYQTKPAVTPQQVPSSAAVLAAFNALLDGIRHADVNAVASVYWKSPRLILFNNNGTVTKGWDQMRENRESSYPDLKDVKLDVRDVSVTMLGRDGAVVSCLWTQSQTYKGTPETASGRMTLIFKRFGTDWKAIHLHTSPDAPNPAGVPPPKQTSSSISAPTPNSQLHSSPGTP